MLLLKAIIPGRAPFPPPPANLSPYPGEQSALELSLKSKSGLENSKPWNFSIPSPQKFAVYQGGREPGRQSVSGGLEDTVASGKAEIFISCVMGCK